MSNTIEKYDLVCSLGGNCAAAHNIQYKKLRIYALPFDWTYFTTEEAVYKLADGFMNNFKEYALKENFKELPINRAHADKIQYEDNYGKIIWANHFLYEEDRELGYQRVKEILDRRFKRLIRLIKKSKKILFLFSVSFSIKPDSFIHLASVLNKLYPHIHIKIHVLSFNANDNSQYIYIYENVAIKVCYYQRTLTDQDFLTTNEEWNFLDNIKITKMVFYTIKQKSLKFLIPLIPYKPLRKKLKKKYHV